MTRKKKVATKLFQVGKNRRTDEAHSPLVGEPNTNLDFYEKKTGIFRGRRKFGLDGKASKDLDKRHSSHGNYDHAHDYDGFIRGKERALTIKEKREMKKASKKRRFWEK